MKFLISFLLAFQFVTSIYTNPMPEPTFDRIIPLIAQAAFGSYGGGLGSGFGNQYPYGGNQYYGGGGSYGGSYGGGMPYGGNQYYGGGRPYGGNQYYG